MNITNFDQPSDIHKLLIYNKSSEGDKKQSVKIFEKINIKNIRKKTTDSVVTQHTSNNCQRTNTVFV